MDQPSTQFVALVRDIAAGEGRHLNDDALAALVAAVDANTSAHFLSRYHDAPPADLVRGYLAPFLASTDTKAPGVSAYGRETAGLAPGVFASLSASERLARVRKFDAEYSGAKAAPKTFRQGRIESEIHAARLRLHSLQGAEREKQAQRVTQLERELSEAKAR